MNRNLIKSLDTNNIDHFHLSEDASKVFMTLKDGSEVELTMNDGFDILAFYDLLKRIAGTDFLKTCYTSAEGFLNAANHAMLLKDIRRICKETGSDADPEDIHSIMLDGFRPRNLVLEGKQTGSMEEAVLEALEKYKALDGKVGGIYAD